MVTSLHSIDFGASWAAVFHCFYNSWLFSPQAVQPSASSWGKTAGGYQRKLQNPTKGVIEVSIPPFHFFTADVSFLSLLIYH